MKKRGKSKPDKPKRSAADEIMTLREVAEYLNCSYSMVYHLARSGSIPCFRLGSDYRFRREDVDAWIPRQRVKLGESQGLVDRRRNG